MSDKTPPKQIVRAADWQKATEAFSHPFNPNSEVYGYPLGMTSGLKRVGLNWIRIPPGKEAFVYHSHQGEEEFLFILSGRGVIEIDDASYEVGPGDFIGFPTPSSAHLLRNPFQEDLVYLSGGEHHDLEVADFPRHGKRMVRVGTSISIFPTAAGENPWAPPPKKQG